MPEGDVFLVPFPAEENFLALAQGGKIDQAALQILHLDLAAVEFHQDVAAFRQGFDEVVDGFAAGVAALGQERAHALVQALETVGAFVQAVQPGADVGQQGAGFRHGVMFGELRRA